MNDVTGNGMTEVAGVQLAAALTTNSTLQKLDLRDTLHTEQFPKTMAVLSVFSAAIGEGSSLNSLNGISFLGK